MAEWWTVISKEDYTPSDDDLYMYNGDVVLVKFGANKEDTND